jgi:hypothetical protein
LLPKCANGGTGPVEAVEIRDPLLVVVVVATLGSGHRVASGTAT